MNSKTRAAALTLRLLLAAGALGVALRPQSASATAYTLSTTTSGGSWANTALWSPTGTPGTASSDIAILPLGTLAAAWNITLDSNPTIAGLSVTSAGAFNATLNPGATATSTLTLHSANPDFTNNVASGQTLTIAAPLGLDTANTLFTNNGTGNLTINAPTNSFFANLKPSGGLGSATALTINNLYTNLPPLTQLKTGAGSLTLALVGAATNTFFTNQNGGSLGGNGGLYISGVSQFSSAAGTAQILTNNGTGLATGASSTNTLELDLDGTSPSAFFGANSFGGLGAASGKTGLTTIRYIHGANTLASSVHIDTSANGTANILNLLGYGASTTAAASVINGGTWNVPGNLYFAGTITLNIDTNMGSFTNGSTLFAGSGNSQQSYAGGYNTINFNPGSTVPVSLNAVTLDSQGGSVGIFNMMSGAVTNLGTFALGGTGHNYDNSTSILNVSGGTLGITNSGGITMSYVGTAPSGSVGPKEYSFLTITNTGVLSVVAPAAINAGKVTVPDTATAPISSQSTISLGGGTLNLGSPIARQTVAMMVNAASTNWVQFYFNGGTLRAITNLPQVFTGFGTTYSTADAVYVSSGGAVINNGGWSVGISNNLLAASGSTGGLTTLGSGTLSLSGANTYTGATTISAGTLTLSGAGQLGGGSYTAAIVNNGTFNFNSSAAQTLSGIISGSGALNLNGSGVLTLTTANTYTGATVISAGTLTLSGQGQLGGGSYAASIVNSGTFNFNSSAAQTLSGIISGSGSLNLNSSGVLTLTAANTYSGATIISAGTLALGSAGSISNSPTIAIGAGATYDVLAISSYTLSGSTSLIATGSGVSAIIKGAAGGTVNLGSRPIILNCDGSNSALTISQGTLSLSGQTITVNSLQPLANGIYNLITQTTGSVTHPGSYSLAGSAGTGTITFSNGNVQMTITGSSSMATATTLSSNDTKIYGNNSTITATVSPSIASGSVQFFVDGVALGNAVTLSSGSATIPATAQVSAGTHSISAAYSGTAGYSPSGTTNAAILTVTPRSLTVSATGVNKTYDGTTNATVTLSDNRLAGDDVTDNYTSAYFADPNIGTNKPVTVTGIYLTGSDAGNYTANTTATTTASILATLDQFDTLRLYWQSNWLIGNPSASTLNNWAATSSNYWSTLNTNAGRTYLWSDLTLGSSQSGINTGSSHMDATFGRLRSMALAWAAPGCPLQGNAALASAITNSLDWMCANIYTATVTEYDNWWDWEIGGLQNFNDTQVLVYPVLTAAQITSYTAAVDHFQPPNKGWMTGANLTDQCKGMLIRGIVGQNSGRMWYAQTNLSPVFLYVTNSDGYYRDGSYIQHGAHPYTGGYGLTTLSDVSLIVNLLLGSTWQISDPNLTNVFNWVTQTYEPVNYYGEWMAMICGRTIARGPAGSSGQGIVNGVESFAPPAVAAAMAAWTSQSQMPPGQYHFPAMDCIVSWRTNFCLALRMSSSRIYNFESFSGENLHGWFTGDGMAYLYLGNPDTQFTSDFWPTVDPYHLPGTTEEQFTRPAAVNNSAYGAGTKTSQTWVGGAQVAGNYGAAGMSVAAYGTTLTGRKSWFMFDNEIVCLGAGITCGDVKGEVDTTVENRRLGSSPTQNFVVNGVTNPPVMGWSSNLTTATWCSLDGTGGYYFPGGATNLHAGFVPNTGSWYAIDNSESTNLYTDNYLTLWFNHGVNPTNATYAYVLLPNYTATYTAAYAANPAVTILTNTPNVQAASKPALGVMAANFWADGTNSAGLITVNRKSSVITSANIFQIAVGVSDPTQTNSGSINVTLNRSATGILSVDPGVTVLQLSPQIILSVNVSGSAGKSFQAVFNSPTNALVWDTNPSGTGTHPLDGSGTWNSSNTNWWNGSADVAWNDTNPFTAVFGAIGTAGTVTVTSAHTNTWLLFNPPASGTYTLAGTGSLTITNGIMANTSANVNVPVNLPVSQTWTVASNQVVSLGGAVTLGSGALLSLTGGGAVKLNAGNNQLPTTTTMAFAGNGIFDLGGNRQSLANILPPNSYIGSVQNGNLTVTATGGFSPFGTLTSPSTLDLSGLSSFTYSNGSQNFTVQGTAAVSGIFNLNLAGSNSITAANIYVGNGGGTSLPTGNLFLGQTNIFNTANFQLGAYRGSGNVYFENGLTTSNVTFRGVTGGSSRLGSMTILSQSSGASQSDTMDLGAANVDALIGTLYVLNTAQPGVTETATLNFGNGTFDITTLDLAYVNSGNNGTASSTGNFNQNGGLAKVQTLNFGATGNTAGTPIFKPSYTLATGATLAASNITAAAGVPYNALTVRNLNLNGGTVSNYNATTDLTISGADNSSGGVVNIILGGSTISMFSAGSGRAITVQSTAPISGSGNFNKTGAGTLTLVGTHSYTGTTLVSAGTLLVNGALGSNIVTVASGATLGGSGSIGGITTLQSGGTLQPGNASGIGTLTNGTLNLGDSFSATTASRVSISAGGKISAAALNVSGTHTINLLDASLPQGTNTLINYTGTIGGSGFTGLKLGTVPSLPTGATAYLRNTGSAVQLVVAPLVAPTLANVVSFGAGGFSLSFSGSSGQSYRVLASTNLSLPLTNWLTLTNGIFGPGVVNFTDSAATNQQEFYRVRSP